MCVCWCAWPSRQKACCRTEGQIAGTISLRDKLIHSSRRGDRMCWADTMMGIDVMVRLFLFSKWNKKRVHQQKVRLGTGMLNAWREERKYGIIVWERGKLISPDKCVLNVGQHYTALEFSHHEFKMRSAAWALVSNYARLCGWRCKVEFYKG